MAAKRDAAAEHGEAQHVAAAEVQPEKVTTAEGAEISMDNKEPAQQRERRRCERMDSEDIHCVHQRNKQIMY